MPTPPRNNRDLSPVPDLTPLGSPRVPYQQLAAADAAVQSQRVTRAAGTRDNGEARSGENEAGNAAQAANGDQPFRREDYQLSPETESEEESRELMEEYGDLEERLDSLDDFFESTLQSGGGEEEPNGSA